MPEGTQTGTTLRLRGKGMPDVSAAARGDLFATVQVQTPKKLTKEQRQLLEQLAKVAADGEVRAAPHERDAGRQATSSIASRTCSADVTRSLPALDLHFPSLAGRPRIFRTASPLALDDLVAGCRSRDRRR